MTFEQILKEHDRDSFARGLDQGRSEGEAKKQQEIAKNLKRLGMAAVEIVKATGLSEAEVAEL